MSERLYPRAWTALLPAESERWVKQGLIDETQRTAVLQLYPEPAAGARDRMIRIFTFLGSLLVGIGVILLFAANWPSIAAPVKVGVILAAVLSAYGAGFYLRYVRDDYPRLGHSLIFLGSLFYGAAIFLLAQIFHLNAGSSQGFLLWGAGLLPLVWVTDSSPILYLSIVTLITWTLNRQSSLDTANYLFPVLLLGAVLPLTRKARTALGEAAALAALFLWFMATLMNSSWATPGGGAAILVAQLAILYGAVLLAVGLARLGGERQYLMTGGGIALAGFYGLTFRVGYMNPYINVPRVSLYSGQPFLTVALAVLLLAAAAAAWFAWRRSGSRRTLLLPFLAVPVVAALTGGLLPEVARMVAFNLLLFAGAVGFVALGIQRHSEWLVNTGLAAFLIHVLTRYFDLFFPAMNRSVFFILGGVLLLGGGWLLERNRRRWMQSWGGDGDDQ